MLSSLHSSLYTSSQGGLKIVDDDYIYQLDQRYSDRADGGWNKSTMPDCILHYTRKWQHINYNDNKAQMVTISHQHFFPISHTTLGHVLRDIWQYDKNEQQCRLTVQYKTQVQIHILVFGKLILLNGEEINNEFYQFFLVSLWPF